MECSRVNKLNNRWGCDFHRVSELKDIKVNRSLKNIIEEWRGPQYRKMMDDRKAAAEFLPVKDPTEFNAVIRKTCEELGTAHRIDAVKIPNCEPKVYAAINDFNEDSPRVYEDDGAWCFGRRPPSYMYNVEEFPTIGATAEGVGKIKTEPELQIKAEIKRDKEITVEMDESMFKCLEISGLPASVKAEDLKTYLQDFGNVQKIQLIYEENGTTTALVWITTSACEWVISCLDDQTAVIKDLEVTLKVQYWNKST